MSRHRRKAPLRLRLPQRLWLALIAVGLGAWLVAGAIWLAGQEGSLGAPLLADLAIGVAGALFMSAIYEITGE